MNTQLLICPICLRHLHSHKDRLRVGGGVCPHNAQVCSVSYSCAGAYRYRQPLSDAATRAQAPSMHRGPFTSPVARSPSRSLTLRSKEAGGEWVAFLVLEQGAAPKKWHAERHGLCSVGAEGSSSSWLERFAGRCCPCSNAASHILKNQCLPGLPASALFCPSRLSYSIVENIG